MATEFTPPTHTEYFAPAGSDRLWSRVPYQRANTVLILDGAGTPTGPDGATVVGGDDLIAADQVFTNANTYPVDDDTAVLLASAGYELSLEDVSWPAWL